jgi:hypothetical protein
MMLFFINLQLNLLCMYYTGKHTGSDSNLSWRSMIKIRR